MKKLVIILGVVLAILLIAFFALSAYMPSYKEGGDNGEASGTSGIRGSVTVGPTCPVERDPPDPNCADKPLEIKLGITNAYGSGVIEEFSSDKDGKFSVEIKPGSYMIHSTGPAMLPRCDSEEIIVSPDTYTEVVVQCDSGIR